ncbi:glutamine amidotransferase [Myroides odoratimimus]|uniref:glutamine amidotransferase-related protein n=1 Tax=Myroides odoratimimus TaxID=76832 RepID=UPI002578A030|nr:glutamine amidotransferase [Myroides odoratimimus]MDM1494669.1 glutamine amidotransferase [Myroides odoratimimus]
MHIHFVIHEEYEGPGAFLDWVKDHNYSVSMTKLYENNILPTSAEHIDLLIVLGGPQDPITTTDECPYFDAQKEKELILKCILAHKAVIGVCLGAQLIGEALCNAYSHSPEKEFGVWPIHLTDEGKTHPKFKHIENELPVGHWHNDMPGLTPDAIVLATSEGCPRQIIEYSNLVYGLQCHMEFTPEVIELIIANDQESLVRYANHRLVQSAQQLMKYDYTTMNQALYTFLDKLVEEYKQLSDVRPLHHL